MQTIAHGVPLWLCRRSFSSPCQVFLLVQNHKLSGNGNGSACMYSTTTSVPVYSEKHSVPHPSRPYSPLRLVPACSRTLDSQLAMLPSFTRGPFPACWNSLIFQALGTKTPSHRKHSTFSCVVDPHSHNVCSLPGAIGGRIVGSSSRFLRTYIR